MSVKIRLRRMGTRGKPFYRIVVADSRTSRDGRFIDLLGYYDPRTEPPTIKIDEEKAVLWLNRGAQPTDTAEALLKKQSIFAGVVTPVSKPRPERKPKESAPEEPAEEPKAEALAEEPKTEAPAEEPKAEELTEEPTTEEPAEEPVVEELTEQQEAEEPVEEPQAEEAAVEPEQMSPEMVAEESPAVDETEAEVEEERQSEEQG